MNKKSQIRVEELKYRLLQQRITNTRFKLPMSFDDAKVYLLAAYQAEVERRHRVFERNEHFNEQLNQIANYLTGGSKKFGLMFCGLCGNGKTTWAKALQLLVSGLNLKNPINNLYYVFPLWNAKDLAMRSKGNYNDTSIIIARCEFRDELREHRLELLKDLVRFFKEYMPRYGYKHLCTEDEDYKYYQTHNLPCVKRGFMGYYCNYGAPLKDVDV